MWITEQVIAGVKESRVLVAAMRERSRAERVARLGRFRYTSHWAHLVVTLLTFGAWAPIWTVLTLRASQHNARIDNDILRQILNEVRR